MGNPILDVADLHLLASLLQVTPTLSGSFHCHMVPPVWTLSFLRPMGGGEMSGTWSEQGEEPLNTASVPVDESGSCRGDAGTQSSPASAAAVVSH